MLAEEAVNDPFIGGEWFTAAFTDPSKLTIRPICFFDGKEIVGFINPRSETNNGKLHWRSGVIYLMKKYRGRGLMAEILYNFFDTHHPAMCWIDNNNSSSIRLYTKLGFVKGTAKKIAADEDGHWYHLQGKPKNPNQKKSAILSWI